MPGNFAAARRKHHCARKLAAQIGIENPKSRKRAGSGRNKNFADTQRGGQRRCVQRARAAKSKQRKISRVVTALNRDAPQSAFHADIGYTHDAFGGCFDGGETAASLAECSESPLRARQIEMHCTAQKMLLVQTAEHQIGIGHCGTLASSVASRTGIGACRLRPHLQSAGGVDPCERASASARGVNVKHGHSNRDARNLTFNAGSRLSCRIEQRNVCGGAAHIEAENAFNARHAGHAECADYASRGS